MIIIIIMIIDIIHTIIIITIIINITVVVIISIIVIIIIIIIIMFSRMMPVWIPIGPYSATFVCIVWLMYIFVTHFYVAHFITLLIDDFWYPREKYYHWLIFFIRLMKWWYVYLEPLLALKNTWRPTSNAKI